MQDVPLGASIVFAFCNSSVEPTGRLTHALLATSFGSAKSHLEVITKTVISNCYICLQRIHGCKVSDLQPTTYGDSSLQFGLKMALL